MKRLFITIVIAINFLSVKAQEPSFSQFWMNEIYLNPAFVGNNDGLNYNLHNRLQWTDVIKHFNTYSFSGSVSIPPLVGGIGLVANYDDEGEGMLTTSQVGIVYSYSQVLKPYRSRLSFAIQGDYGQKKLNGYDNLVFSNQLDPVLGQVNPSSVNLINDQASYFNSDFGVVFDEIIGKTFQHELILGAALHNAIATDVSLLSTGQKLNKKITFHSSIYIKPKNFRGETIIGINPYIIYEKSFYKTDAAFNTILLGSNFFIATIELGVGYRKSKPVFDFKKSDAIIFNLNYLFTIRDKSNVTMGFSYDATVSHLAGNSGGSFEIGLKFSNADFVLFNGKGGYYKEHRKSCKDFSGKRFKQKGWM